MITSVVVAGLRGGVGTTTVTALCDVLLRSAGATTSLADHTEGRLQSRVAGGNVGGAEVSLRSLQLGFAPGAAGGAAQVDLLDAGVFHPNLTRLLDHPATGFLLVASPAGESMASLESAVEHVASAVGENGRDRLAALVVDTGRHWRRVPALPHVGGVQVVGLPWTAGLVPWRPVTVPAAGRPVLAAVAQGLDEVLGSPLGPGSELH